MIALWQDIRYGVRMLRKSPGFTAIALITLAIGISANTVMFSVVNMLVFRPMQVKDPDRLVYCGIQGSPGFRYEDYTDIRDDNPAFSDLIAVGGGMGSRGTWLQGAVVSEMRIAYVSANYFSALGVNPIHGRTFLPEEERHGAEPVVVLSHRTWQTLGGDPNVAGQVAHINAQPCRIIGVAPEGFTGTMLHGPDIWLPLGAYGLVDRRHRDRPYPLNGLIGRLKPDLDMAAAEARLQMLGARLKEQMNTRWKNNSVDYRLKDNARLVLTRLGKLSLGEDDRVQKGMRQWSMVLMAISFLVLLIACLNLANMLNAQGTDRQREIAIRLAMGGGRLRIIRQLLIESLLLALLGAVLALIPSLVGIRMFNAWLALAVSDEVIQIPTSFDMRVFGATLGICLIATIMFGLKPALNLSKRDIIGDLKESGAVVQTLRRRRRLLPRGLSVIGQTALSVAFVMVAMLFMRTAQKLGNTYPGLDLHGKILVKIDALASGYAPAQVGAACERLAERLKGMPGIQAVGWSMGFPVGDSYRGSSPDVAEYRPGVEEDNVKSLFPRGALTFPVNGEYFEAMGMPLLQGRPFGPLDHAAGAEPVVIIGSRLAHKLRRDGNVLDCLIQHGWGSDLQVCRVVGVVSTLRDPYDETSEWGQIYQPISPDQAPIYMHIRTAPERESPLLQNLGSMIHEIDPMLVVVSLMSLAEHHRGSYAVQQARMNAQVITLFGMQAMFLAGLGLYAVKAHMVATRTHEIGVRMALGASRRSVLTLVFRQNGLSTLAGLVLGIVLAIGLTSLIRGALYGIGPTDPVSIIATVSVLALTSLLAGYVPAQRAVKIDPMVALRCE
ncbi:MAG: ADOP family duplicated permease [Sedimentisphaerales bacterium]|nr:ADOP family duplicated permease [Sedimentisphaerales bacterium]HNY76950.1 ADOP family duplicated permease [Sedimentisphaerales bacterium]HOC62804.1 ADOP family duplicated permease [Sedimentisphaerales bacterium]HOH62724.1 ADOP family duplicated permease [Sedimentisphaerales bacterium]HQA88808.1 ADOP family duplicated permease [Sedimentisphaerales bacterium]